MPSLEKRAVVLLSGGIDSATAGAMAKADGFTLFALSLDYGQRHAVELDAAKRIAVHLGALEHRIVRVDLRAIGGSALTDAIAVPKERTPAEMRREIPVTYVPARNTIFLAIALGYAETRGAADIFFGANAIDYSGYPDCRPDYLEAFEKLASLATKAGIEGKMSFRVHAPILHMTKAEILRTGAALGLDYSLTHSCYDPDARGFACGRCDSCLLRKNGFEEADIPDPTKYAS